MIRVEFEASDSRAFDDVVIHYDDGMRDELGQRLEADHYQIKFHQRANGAITWDDLISPDFINASKISFLQRLHAVQQQFAPGGLGHRLFLYSPWTVDSHDELAEVFSQQDGRIRLRDLVANRPDRGKSVVRRCASTWGFPPTPNWKLSCGPCAWSRGRH